mmetsp:Transcript_24720/g.71336  ORF Transcript_24720/g.71336 Transcript_24720/m.71336 type:complete len:208 (-) Transcript_24720:1381-2004(-)
MFVARSLIQLIPIYFRGRLYLSAFKSNLFRLCLAAPFFVPIAVQIRDAISLIAALGTKLIVNEGLGLSFRPALAFQPFPGATSEALSCHPTGRNVLAGDATGVSIGSGFLLFFNTTLGSFVGLAFFGTSLRAKLLVEPVCCCAAIGSEGPAGASFVIALHPRCHIVAALDTAAVVNFNIDRWRRCWRKCWLGRWRGRRLARMHRGRT